MAWLFGDPRTIVEELNLERGPNAEPSWEMEPSTRVENEMAEPDYADSYHLWNATSVREVYNIYTGYPNLTTRQQAYNMLLGYRGWARQQPIAI